MLKNQTQKIIYLIISACLLSVFVFVNNGYAQYFGRNKVNYDNFNFKILHTKHFDIYYYKEEKDAVDYAARMSERWYARRKQVMDDTLEGKQVLILYDGFPQFAETNVTSGSIGQGTGGFTEPMLRRIVLPFAGPLEETNHVIGHELTHAFQFDISKRLHETRDGIPSAAEMPLWFIEGMAEYFSLGPVDPNTAMWMREAALKKLPNISDLDNPKYFPYRYGQALLAFMGGTFGNQKITELLRVAGRKGSVKNSIDSVFHMSADSLSKLWHIAMRKEYDSLAKVTSRPEKYGPELISEKKGAGQMNISPVLSPDGKYIIFFSSKDLFGIDLYLADAKTGKIIKNVFRTELNIHLQNLEFINSAGAWNPDGKEFVFSGVAKGRPLLSILNVDKAKVTREIPFPKLAEIFNTSWSPDGRYIVFSALAKGFSNLFMYDLKTDSLKQLTDDPYAELQPAWSPDGKEIAFVTDRFNTNLTDLKFGNYRLALLNPETDKITELKCFSKGKNINPQWSPDGKSIYFISDQNGIDDIYRLNTDSAKIYQITNLYGGISGITALSPAISVAGKSNKLVYSVFQDNKYNIFSIDSLNLLEGEKPKPEFATGNPEILPPVKNLKSKFYADFTNPHIGLPSDTTKFKSTSYGAGLALVGVGQPSVGVGADEFGTYLGGGIALFWSDMLGNHNLSTALQIQYGNNMTDISGLVGYMNTANRWNWGGVIQQVPYILSGYNIGYSTINNQPAYVQQEYIYRETDREARGIVAYPFNQSMRLELSGGFTNINFYQQVTTQALSLNTGSVLINSTQTIPSPPDINLGTVSAALVFDNSYFGATDPILGTRYRFQVGLNQGNLKWFDILGDFRQYWMPIRPVTIAARILQYGRYGASADDYRLQPEYLGYPGLVRGYESSSFTAGEFQTDSAATYKAWDDLIGSKILVGNLEIRFPLFGIFGLGEGFYGYFPIEMAFFYDAGYAWSNDQKISLFGGSRAPVTSAGVALRINLFGYAVGEVDYVRPFSRPGVGWLWQFDIIQGF